jgi:hypothetical protein
MREQEEPAKCLAEAVMRWKRVPPPAIFQDNTAAFVH